jgi:hypothetical protein
MRITLMVGDQEFGSAEWESIPAVGTTIHLWSLDGLKNEARSVEKVEDSAPNSKIVRLGGAHPIFTFSGQAGG